MMKCWLLANTCALGVNSSAAGTYCWKAVATAAPSIFSGPNLYWLWQICWFLLLLWFLSAASALQLLLSFWEDHVTKTDPALAFSYAILAAKWNDSLLLYLYLCNIIMQLTKCCSSAFPTSSWHCHTNPCVSKTNGKVMEESLSWTNGRLLLEEGSISPLALCTPVLP